MIKGGYISSFLTIWMLLLLAQEKVAATDTARVKTPREKSDFAKNMHTDLSFHLGPSQYLGDLGGTSSYNTNFLSGRLFKRSTFFYGVSITKRYRSVLGLRFDYTAGKIAGSDAETEYQNTQDDQAYTRYKRNLDFRTNINEGSMQLEWYPLHVFRDSSKISRFPLQPFFSGGIGYFHFNPQGSYYDELSEELKWVDLQPLRTEGQGMTEYPERSLYKLNQWCIPFGGGLMYTINPKVSLALEISGRYLFTDYLDDVSTTFIDPALFNKYLTPAQADIAKKVHNKSNLIDPNQPYGVGEIRGSASSNDFFYSVQFRLLIRISKK
jgi:hypothetical protein